MRLLFQVPRYRAILASTVALLIYVATTFEFVDQRLVGDGALFVGAVAAVVLACAWYLKPNRITAWLVVGALVVPVLASSIGYLALLLGFYFKNGYLQPSQSVLSWLPIVLVFPFFGCRVWVLSIALPTIGAALQVASEKLTEGVPN
jgi:hypothetical protein